MQQRSFLEEHPRRSRLQRFAPGILGKGRGILLAGRVQVAERKGEVRVIGRSRFLKHVDGLLVLAGALVDRGQRKVAYSRPGCVTDHAEGVLESFRLFSHSQINP